MPKSNILALAENLDLFTSSDGQAFVRLPVLATRGFYILPRIIQISQDPGDAISSKSPEYPSPDSAASPQSQETEEVTS